MTRTSCMALLGAHASSHGLTGALLHAQEARSWGVRVKAAKRSSEGLPSSFTATTRSPLRANAATR
jgi:hypothetical protein